mgnify:CR=1 FL=1
MTDNNIPRLATATACALLLAGTAKAQDAAEERQAAMQVAQAELQLQRQVLFDEGADHFALAAGDLAAQRVVKGAPYCADAVHETVQWLPDGQGGAANRIVRQQSTRLCRDGEGRTRQEVDRNGRKLVYLRDPVSRENWVLDPERKTARRLAMFDAAGVRELAERAREQAQEQARVAVERVRIPAPPAPPAPPTPPTPPVPVIIAAPEAAPDGARTRTETRVLRINRDGESTEWTLPPAAVQWRAQAFAPRGAGSVSPLGARDVEGLRANGERTTWTIEAGKIGNEKPIVITREVWTSPDLMITISSRDFDPRTGETNYRLKGVKRGEPDATLMRVPADFSKPSPRPSPRASGAAG